MINLLPSDIKKQYSYARRNTSLLKWSIAILIGIAGVAAIVAGGMFYMNQSINNLAKQNEIAQQALKDQKLEENRAKVQEISGSIKLAVQVLSKEILFSKLISQVGTVMPSGTVLTNLQISTQNTGVDISAVALDYKSATQIQVNLADPANQIFEKADILNINCNNQAVDKYPCTVSIKAQFVKTNPFLFISTKNGAKQ